MKENLHIKKALTLVSLIGLLTLLLFAPCKVRMSVQTALDLSQTEVSNKSVCQVYETMELTTSITQTAQPNALPIIDNKPQRITFANLSKYTVKHFTDKSESVSQIPFYILYQNLKVHL